MKKYLLAAFLLMNIFYRGLAQEMVQNGSFEMYSGCPGGNSAGALDSALFWSNPAIEEAASPDYYNACVVGYLDVPLNFTGYQSAYEGSAYAGIVTCLEQPSTNYREYIENELAGTLIANKCYHFEMKVSAADYSKYVVPEIHVYFSDTLVANLPTSQPMPFIPQLTLVAYPGMTGWTTYHGYYTAHGTENYLIIGNFRSASQTDFYVLDPGGPWSFAYDYIDNVSLRNCSAAEMFESGVNKLSVFPNPAANSITIEGINELPGLQSVAITSSSGITIPVGYSQDGEIDLSGFAAGVYFLTVVHDNGTSIARFIKE